MSDDEIIKESVEIISRFLAEIRWYFIFFILYTVEDMLNIKWDIIVFIFRFMMEYPFSFFVVFHLISLIFVPIDTHIRIKMIAIDAIIGGFLIVIHPLSTWILILRYTPQIYEKNVMNLCRKRANEGVLPTVRMWISDDVTRKVFKIDYEIFFLPVIFFLLLAYESTQKIEYRSAAIIDSVLYLLLRPLGLVLYSLREICEEELEL